MTAFRWVFGLPLAAFVTILLTLMMSVLIRQEMPLAPERSPVNLSLVPKIKDSALERREPVRPTLSEAPPPPDIRPTYRMDVSPFGVSPPTDIEGPGIEVVRGQATPTIRVAPPYPEACASKGVEGVVLVRFDVTAEGAVANPEIISSPDGCFDRTVLRAVSGWKYAPDIRDGRAAPRRGVVERFVFELEE